MEEHELIWTFGLGETTRVNAPPVQPYDEIEEGDEDLTALRETFAPTKHWRGDSSDRSSQKRSEYEQKILSHCDRFGRNSLYATARCPRWGLSCLHAAAMNGYLALVKTFIEVARMHPVQPTAKVLDSLAWADGHHGADALWLARKRGHQEVVKYLLTLPAVVDADAMTKADRLRFQRRSSRFSSGSINPMADLLDKRRDR